MSPAPEAPVVDRHFIREGTFELAQYVQFISLKDRWIMFFLWIEETANMIPAGFAEKPWG